MGKALKGDSPEGEVVLTRPPQRHALTRTKHNFKQLICMFYGREQMPFAFVGGRVGRARGNGQ